MEVTVKVDVTNCKNCPFARSHQGHGECWTECAHKDHGRDCYQNILWGCQEHFSKVPEWCPIGLGKAPGA